nr:hypothetical protein [Frankia sp. AiPa1]
MWGGEPGQGNTVRHQIVNVGIDMRQQRLPRGAGMQWQPVANPDAGHRAARTGRVPAMRMPAARVPAAPAVRMPAADVLGDHHVRSVEDCQVDVGTRTGRELFQAGPGRRAHPSHAGRRGAERPQATPDPVGAVGEPFQATPLDQFADQAQGGRHRQAGPLGDVGQPQPLCRAREGVENREHPAGDRPTGLAVVASHPLPPVTWPPLSGPRHLASVAPPRPRPGDEPSSPGASPEIFTRHFRWTKSDAST